MELIDEQLVVLDADCTTKEEVVNLMADAMDGAGRLCVRVAYVSAVF